MTRDDEKTIIDCLESALRHRLFTKIFVLLDTKSTDRTARILNEYRRRNRETIQIVPFGWSNPPNFADARNYCIGCTDTPYAFWIDGDEILKKPEQLRQMLQRANGQAFQMWVISPVSGGQHNMYQPRLFPVRPGVRFECPVFERLDWSLHNVGIPIEGTDADPIFHPGYVNPATLKVKNLRNVKIIQKYLREENCDSPQRQHLLTQFTKLKSMRI
jgi:glycosyltransferase involved in cell wall biosynthesis